VNRGAAVLPHQAAAGRFRALTEAYRMLSDPGRRAAYDRALGRARLLRDAAGGAGAAARAGRCDGTAPVPGPPLRVGPVRVDGLRRRPADGPGEDEIRLALLAGLALRCLARDRDWPWRDRDWPW
jgi:curved DNA-binding protein CbpA